MQYCADCAITTQYYARYTYTQYYATIHDLNPRFKNCTDPGTTRKSCEKRRQRLRGQDS